MKLLLSSGFVLASVVPALAVVAEWGQCGGINYTGETACASGLTCTYQNDYFYQCLKSSSTAVTSATSASSSAASSTSASSTSAVAVPTGFVKTSGTRFTVNGAKIVPVGTNSYWVGLAGYSTADKTQAFKEMAATGATVVRTWGFNDILSTNPNGYPIYYQSWNGATPTVNTGATGLANFDTVVSLAKASGLRLIVPLVNNWGDYGGMDVYVKQLLGSDNHDLFYTDATVKAAFKNYIKAFVSRYASEPGIFAWELANEPRCKGSTGTTTGTCTTTTITNWATEISAYIKSIDSNHLVAIGDEGFYNQPSNPSYPYQGAEGIDFDVNLKISSIDFGTFHAYPIPWGQTADPQAWGNQWITDHAASMTAVGKPVIIEEFGVVDNQETVYASWWSTIVSSGLTGDLIWQAGSILSGGSTWDDGYGVFAGDEVYKLQTAHSAALKARAT